MARGYIHEVEGVQPREMKLRAESPALDINKLIQNIGEAGRLAAYSENADRLKTLVKEIEDVDVLGYVIEPSLIFDDAHDHGVEFTPELAALKDSFSWRDHTNVQTLRAYLQQNDSDASPNDFTKKIDEALAIASDRQKMALLVDKNELPNSIEKYKFEMKELGILESEDEAALDDIIMQTKDGSFLWSEPENSTPVIQRFLDIQKTYEEPIATKEKVILRQNIEVLRADIKKLDKYFEQISQAIALYERKGGEKNLLAKEIEEIINLITQQEYSVLSTGVFRQLKSESGLSKEIAHDLSNFSSQVVSYVELVAGAGSVKAGDPMYEFFRDGPVKNWSTYSAILEDVLLRRAHERGVKFENRDTVSPIPIDQILAGVTEFVEWRQNSNQQDWKKVTIQIGYNIFDQEVIGNKGFIVNTILNFVSNAVRDQVGADQVTISFNIERGSLVAKVTDNGSGIPNDIFSEKGMFSRGVSGSGSTGIGLGSVLERAAEFDGQIQFTTKKEGEEGEEGEYLQIETQGKEGQLVGIKRDQIYMEKTDSPPIGTIAQLSFPITQNPGTVIISPSPQLMN